ncbi:hypothetical protein DQ04_06951030 [Trypanosoma grayi]|uniref:hypothetical protein n=1 Tax=Trypanosoma grayi TaxID=71804 RepID=UPI0004F462AB|nr:hypothetical protein DQ04_06951030 [Trypanosoma grayi]KEG08544.1 hypothetical protein DQ04_06951030 [Trypanosoma grayi]
MCSCDHSRSEPPMVLVVPPSTSAVLLVRLLLLLLLLLPDEEGPWLLLIGVCVRATPLSSLSVSSPSSFRAPIALFLRCWRRCGRRRDDTAAVAASSPVAGALESVVSSLSGVSLPCESFSSSCGFCPSRGRTRSSYVFCRHSADGAPQSKSSASATSRIAAKEASCWSSVGLRQLVSVVLSMPPCGGGTAAVRSVRRNAMAITAGPRLPSGSSTVPSPVSR